MFLERNLLADYIQNLVVVNTHIKFVLKPDKKNI